MDPDELFDVLADAERRRVLEHLLESDATTHVGLLKNGCDVNGTHLRHVHLPKMNRAGIVEFDPQTGDVALTDDGTALERFLEALDEVDAARERTDPPGADAGQYTLTPSNRSP
jgi:hypothetical protein